MDAEQNLSEKSLRDHFIEVFIQSWLCRQTSQTLEEVKVSLESLGRPARDAILKAGGLEAFIRASPYLTLKTGRLVPVPTDGTGEASREELLNRIDQFSPTELKALNEQLNNVRLEPKNGAVVSALQKRGQIEELRKKCREKKKIVNNLKEKLVELEKSSSSTEIEEKTIEELVRRRDELLSRVAEGSKIVKRERKLRKDMIKVDTRIENTEDELERLKLKMMMVEEKLISLRQDLFFDSKQHETVVEQLLKEHSVDTDRTVHTLKVMVEEKISHSKDLLDEHIAAVSTLLQNSSSREGLDTEHLNRLLTDYRKKRLQLDEVENHFRQRERLDLTQVVQLPVVKIRDLETIQGDKRQSVIFPSRVEDVFLADDEQSVEEAASVEVSSDLIEKCLICLHTLNSEDSESLICSHRFHSSCLREMHSHGHTSCPLCRCYEPSPADFPSLSN